jgi:glycolate oxidase iron-sulfur subunit
VVYHELIEETRARLAARRKQDATLTDRLVEAMFLRVFTRPTRLKMALLPARLLQRIGVWSWLSRSRLAAALPEKLRKMQQMLPPRGPWWERKLRPYYSAQGAAGGPDNAAATPPPKARVGFFAGCIGSVLFQEVNRQTIDLMRLAGCEVFVPPTQACCGAIHHHAGRTHQAEAMARANIDAFLPLGHRGAAEHAAPEHARPLDYVTTNIAGCGAMLKDYAHLLRDDKAYAERAREFVSRVRDVNELLVRLNPPRPRHALPRRVTYHDACHLAHAQKVTQPPRELLSWIPRLEVALLRESDTCCGAAGTYNLTQPGMAQALAERKIRHLEATGAGTCVTANVGCAMQIQSEAARLGVRLEVVHPVTLLHEAYFGPRSHGDKPVQPPPAEASTNTAP